MSLYFKSEEDTMKNEIPADIFLVPPPPLCLRKNIYQIIEGFYYKLFSHYQCWASYSKNVVYYSLLVTPFKSTIVTLLITFWQQ